MARACERWRYQRGPGSAAAELRDWRMWARCVAVVGGSILALVVTIEALALVSDRLAPTPAEDALGMARVFVEDELLVPSSVRWDYDSERVTEEPGGAYLVSGRLTAKNALGVPLRQRWEARVTPVPGTSQWRCTHIQID